MGVSLKPLTILLIVGLATSSFFMVEFTTAQSTTKPSVPEFNIEVVDNSYYVPATTPVYSIDPYTGEKTMTQEGHEGYPVQNGTINLTIQTQKFTSYYDKDDQLIQLYFRIAYKGNFETSWNYYPSNRGYNDNDSQYRKASADGTNKVQFGFGHFSFNTGEYTSIDTPPSFGEIPKDGKIDFKVETFIGYSNAAQQVTPWGLRTYYTYIGELSGWSNIQTINMPDSSITVSPPPTVTEFFALAILPLLVALPLIITLIQRKRRFQKSV